MKINSEPLIYEQHWADYLMQIVTANTEYVRDIIDMAQANIPNFDRFATEVASHLYLYPDDHHKLDSCKAEAKWAEAAFEQLEKSAEYQELKLRCEGDRLASCIAMGKFINTVATQFPQPEEPLQNLEELRDRIRGINDRERMLQQHSSPLEPMLYQLREDLKQQGVEAAQKAIAFAESLMAGGEAQEQLAQAFVIAADNANIELDKVGETMHCLGWDDSEGTPQNSAHLEDKLALALLISRNPKLRMIFDQAGRLVKRFVDKKSSPTTDGYIAKNIELGDELEKVLKSEISSVAIASTKPIFAQKYADRQLLQYQTRGKYKAVKGAIVACLDSSGSMEGAEEIWAKGVVAALYTVAARQKRHLRVIHFCSSVARIDDFPPKDKGNISRLAKTLQYFSGGGTNWQEPLDKAVEVIKSSKQLKHADIILITDGECSVKTEWLDKFKKTQSTLGFTVYGVAIGCISDVELRPIVNKLVRIQNLNQDNEIEAVFDI